MNIPPRSIQPFPPSPEYAVEYECNDVISRTAALAGLNEVEMNAVRLAAAISEMSQAEFLQDLLLAAAESYVSELGAGQIYLRKGYGPEPEAGTTTPGVAHPPQLPSADRPPRKTRR
jgi:hypothetical protein